MFFKLNLYFAIAIFAGKQDDIGSLYDTLAISNGLT